MKLNEAKKILKKSGYLITERYLPDNETRADFDGDYMGSYYKYYDLNDPCTDKEWAEAGKQWAQDMLDNEEFDEDEFEEAMEHYEFYEFKG